LHFRGARCRLLELNFNYAKGTPSVLANLPQCSTESKLGGHNDNKWGNMKSPAIQTLGLLKLNSQLKLNSNYTTVKCK